MTSVSHGRKKDAEEEGRLERREHGTGGIRRERREGVLEGAFLRDVAFASHHAYVTLREGHVRALTIRSAGSFHRVLSRTPLLLKRRRRPRCCELCSPLALVFRSTFPLNRAATSSSLHLTHALDRHLLCILNFLAKSLLF